MPHLIWTYAKHDDGVHWYARLDYDCPAIACLEPAGKWQWRMVTVSGEQELRGTLAEAQQAVSRIMGR
jgi:hypothetical protein